MVLGEADTGSYFGRIADDALVAVQAAQTMADRFGWPVAIQEDLSVVFAHKTTRKVLELIHPSSYAGKEPEDS